MESCPKTTDAFCADVKGVDIFDPTTGEVRSDGAGRDRLLVHRHRLQRRDFFVRHAYFPGAEHPLQGVERH